MYVPKEHELEFGVGVGGLGGLPDTELLAMPNAVLSPPGYLVSVSAPHMSSKPHISTTADRVSKGGIL